jgi:DNA-binding PadR family transcriptional regulator
MPALTPLGVAALGLLDERSMHPYEMFQLMVQRAEDRLVKVRPGSLYHTVDRLAQDGLVTALGTERAGNRPERTVYEITDAGRLALSDRVADLLGTPVNEYPVFPLAVAEAHNLPADTVAALLRRRLEQQDAVIRSYQAGLESVRARGVPRRYWVDAELSLALLRAETDWIRTFLDELATGALDWDAAEQKDHA